MEKPSCLSFRRFGIELEYNTSDGVVTRPDPSNREIPKGADEIALILNQVLRQPVWIYSWSYFHNNQEWLVKPDNSCGIEINTPILRGWKGLLSLLRVIDAMKANGIQSDNRCSFHIHVDISDLDLSQLGSVIAWWIKCEHVFCDSFPSYRKNNRYCQLLGMTDLFTHNFKVNSEDLLYSVSGSKYYSLNAYHFVKGGSFSSENCRRKTIEFRMAEGDMCLDSYMAKNWVRLILHFIEIAKDLPLPGSYRKNNRKSGLLWLDVKDVFKILKFDREVSEGLSQVRRWFLDRLSRNCRCDLPGIWSNAGRSVSLRQIQELMKRSSETPFESLETAVYGDKYMV